MGVRRGRRGGGGGGLKGVSSAMRGAICAAIIRQVDSSFSACVHVCTFHICASKYYLPGDIVLPRGRS